MIWIWFLKLFGILIISFFFVYFCCYILKLHRKKSELHYPILIIFFVCVGIIFVFNNEISKLSIFKDLLTIEKSVDNIKNVEQTMNNIMKRVENQSATIDLIAKKASDTEKLLEMISEFHQTILSAQSDNGFAFDKLNVWAKDKSYPLSSIARSILDTIIFKESEEFIGRVKYTINWSKSKDPQKFTIVDFQNEYKTSILLKRKLALIDLVWDSKSLTKKEKMKFFIDITKTDKSLKAKKFSGWYFVSIAALDINPMDFDYLINWWEENKNEIH